MMLTKDQFLAEQSALYDKLFGAAAPVLTSTGPTLVAAAGPIPMGSIQPQWDGDGKAITDFWHMGCIGAQKGAPAASWRQDEFVEMWAGAPWNLLHTFVVTPNGDLQSAADVGWMDGSRYNPDDHDEGKPRSDAWETAGRPSNNQFGGQFGYSNTGDRALSAGPGVALPTPAQPPASGSV